MVFLVEDLRTGILNTNVMVFTSRCVSKTINLLYQITNILSEPENYLVVNSLFSA